ncbi:MAG: radical SAM family heme chaperone HemW [Phycisphaerae bacterium]
MQNSSNKNTACLYIHIPFCKAKCVYCGFYSEPIINYDPARLIEALIKELAGYDWSQIETKTVYIGGGSPSCLPERLLLYLIEQIILRCPAAEEFTVEVNPVQTDDKLLTLLRSAGVNRLSIGGQSFNPQELVFLGRKHTSDDIKQAVKTAQKAGFENISLDLIFAIPNSTIDSWKYTLKSAIELNVQHISAYALTYEENTPLQKMITDGQVKPIEEEIDRLMYETAIDGLENAGFKQYEISNFAKPGFQCRHNLNYWANKPYIGIGPSAASYWQGKRRQNVKNITKYIEMIETSGNAAQETESPDKLQIACETAVLNLRRISGINLTEYEAAAGYDALKLFSEPIERYKKLGLIDVTDGRIFLTRQALPIADSILCDFSDV